ncbi:MAG: thioredoxin [Salinivirgaceae bacterium]|jgi:thioredoxin|nr:thioredoxin [Salinivirgaceae bacterium]
MKRNITLLLLAIMTISFGCANTSGKSDDNTTETVVKNEASEETGIPIHLTNATFKKYVFNYELNKEWKYEGDLPCIIDFYADWCGPCKRIAPVLEELAKEYEGRIIIYKVNTEQQRELASAFAIQSIPALLFVPAKGQPQMAQGALPKESFIVAIKVVLLVK